MESEEIKQKRRDSIEMILKDIINVHKYSNFYSHTYCKLMHLALRSKLEKENLFDKEKWSKAENQDELIIRIEQFLTKYIK